MKIQLTSPSVLKYTKRSEQTSIPENKDSKPIEGSATSAINLPGVMLDLSRQSIANAKIENQLELFSSISATHQEQNRLVNSNKSSGQNDARKNSSKPPELKASPYKIRASSLYLLNHSRFKQANEHSTGIKGGNVKTEISVSAKSSAAAHCPSLEENNGSSIALRTPSSLPLFQSGGPVNVIKQIPPSPAPPQKRKPAQQDISRVSPYKRGSGSSWIIAKPTDGLLRAAGRSSFEAEDCDTLKSKPGGCHDVQLVEKQEQHAPSPSTTEIEDDRGDKDLHGSPFTKQDISMQSIPETLGRAAADIFLEDNNIIESADRYSKGMEDMCKLLRKKHEEAKDLFVRALVNNNMLLMLSSPMKEDKISFTLLAIIFF